MICKYICSLIFLKTSFIAHMHGIIQSVIIAGYEGAEITEKYITRVSNASANTQVFYSIKKK